MKKLNKTNKILLIVLIAVVVLIAGAVTGIVCHKNYVEKHKDDYKLAVAAQVDGRDVTLAQLEPYVKMSYASLSEYLGTDFSLDTDMGDGTTVAQYLLFDALTAWRTYALMETKAAALGVELTAEQEAALERSMAAFDPASAGTDAATWEYISRCDMLYAGLYDYFYGENGAAVPTDEEVLAWCRDNGVIRADYILLYYLDENGQPYDEEGLAAQKQLGDDILLLYATGSDFEELIAQYSYGGAHEDTYMSTSDCYQNFINAYYTLDDGQLSDVVEFEYGFFIIRRLPIEPEHILASGNMTGQLFSEMVAKWSEEQTCLTTDAYEAMTPELTARLLGLDAES